MDYEYKHKGEIIRATQLWECGDITRDNLEYIFPELAESEDERIRKVLIDLVKCNERSGYTLLNNVTTDSMLAWLEKQGEQKATDTVEPKFKVGDTMRTLQEANDGYTDGMPVVVSIDNEYYHCTNELIAIKDQDDYEFPPINVKQKSAEWSEEDSKVIDNCCLLIAAADDSYEKAFKDDCIHYLQNLKQMMGV